MTAINIATDIPSNINTLEKLVAWGVLGLARCNPGLKILENPNADPERAAQAVLIKADDGSYRLVLRASIKVIDGYAESTQKFWFNCQELSETALPAAFKSNT